MNVGKLCHARIIARHAERDMDACTCIHAGVVEMKRNIIPGSLLV